MANMSGEAMIFLSPSRPSDYPWIAPLGCAFFFRSALTLTNGFLPLRFRPSRRLRQKTVPVLPRFDGFLVSLVKGRNIELGAFFVDIKQPSPA